MPTLESIATDTVAAIGVPSLGYPMVAQWVKARYQQLATRTKLKHLRKLGQVNIPAAVSITSGATCTPGSAAVSLAAVPNIVPLTSAIGRFVRFAVVWYEIEGITFSVSGAVNMQLKQPFTETAISNGAYTIVSRYTKLPQRAAYLGTSWVHARRRTPLVRTTMERLNLQAPYRPLVGSSGPMQIAEGPELDGFKSIEVYPYPSNLESLFYVYWEDVPEIALTEELSTRIKSYALKEGTLIDCYRYLMNDALQKMQLDQAGFYRNEMRTQETKWEQYLRELILADQGDEDGSFILRFLGTSFEVGEVRTARDQVWST